MKKNIRLIKRQLLDTLSMALVALILGSAAAPTLQAAARRAAKKPIAERMADTAQRMQISIERMLKKEAVLRQQLELARKNTDGYHKIFKEIRRIHKNIQGMNKSMAVHLSPRGNKAFAKEYQDGALVFLDLASELALLESYTDIFERSSGLDKHAFFLQLDTWANPYKLATAKAETHSYAAYFVNFVQSFHDITFSDEQTEAAKLIQRIGRGYNARKQYKKHKHNRQRRAANKIQALARMRAAKKRAQEKAQERKDRIKRNHAEEVLGRALKSYKAKRHQRKREEARTYLREQANKARLKNKSATKIQARFRGHKTRNSHKGRRVQQALLTARTFSDALAKVNRIFSGEIPGAVGLNRWATKNRKAIKELIPVLQENASILKSYPDHKPIKVQLRKWTGKRHNDLVADVLDAFGIN